MTHCGIKMGSFYWWSMETQMAVHSSINDQCHSYANGLGTTPVFCDRLTTSVHFCVRSMKYSVTLMYYLFILVNVVHMKYHYALATAQQMVTYGLVSWPAKFRSSELTYLWPCSPKHCQAYSFQELGEYFISSPPFAKCWIHERPLEPQSVLIAMAPMT